MAGIIEIWRRTNNAALPARFVVGASPHDSSNEPMDAPVVESIVYRELKTLGKLRFEEPVFCVSFVDSFVQRFIPASAVEEIAYETKAADTPKTPAMEG